MLSISPDIRFPKHDTPKGINSRQFVLLNNQVASLSHLSSKPDQSRGRLISEPACPSRNAFGRDRDRIIHSTAFRRLGYKTQVFVCHEGDHYRSRLTHSLEVSQIARSIAHILHVNEDLCEAISLAHDLGHAPFGHAGERALAFALKGFGGFDHNLQTLHLLTELEQSYIAFKGLNLSWETLEGLIKHNGPLIDKDGLCIAKKTLGLALPEKLRGYEKKYAFGLHQQAGIEAQIAAVADDIAYNSHDIDDGIRAGLFEIDDLEQVPFVGKLVEEIRRENTGLLDERIVFELNRRLITLMINDVVTQGLRGNEEFAPVSPNAVRELDRPLVCFTPEFERNLQELRDFLKNKVYRNEKVMKVMVDAEGVIEDLVRHFMNRPQDLPQEWRRNLVSVNINQSAECIRNYIAGMTDRFALDLHRSLFDVTPKMR